MEDAQSPGIISILTHAGDPRTPWSAREIDRLPTSHRLRFADIDGTGKKVLAIRAPGRRAARAKSWWVVLATMT